MIWWKRKGLGQVESIDTGTNIGPPPCKISRISSIPPQVGCKNMQFVHKIALLEDIHEWLQALHFEMVEGGMYWFRFFKLMTDLLPPSFFFTRNRLLTNWLFAETFFRRTFSIATFFKRFPIFSATADFSFRLRWISLGNCCCTGLRKKRNLISLHNF